MFLRVLSKGYWGCPSFQPLIISAHIENSDPMEICEACRRPRPWRWLILLDIKWTCFCPSMSCVCRYNSILRYTNINMYIYIYVYMYIYIYTWEGGERKPAGSFSGKLMQIICIFWRCMWSKNATKTRILTHFFRKKKQWVKCGSVGKEL